jgi:hypothetical protein
MYNLVGGQPTSLLPGLVGSSAAASVSSLKHAVQLSFNHAGGLGAGKSRLEAVRYGHSDETRERQDKLDATQKASNASRRIFPSRRLYFGRNSVLRAAPLSNAKCSGSSSPGWHTPLCGRAFRVQLGPGAFGLHHND